MTDFEPKFPDAEAPTEPESVTCPTCHKPTVRLDFYYGCCDVCAANASLGLPEVEPFDDTAVAYEPELPSPAAFATAGVLPFVIGTVEPTLPTAEAILKAAERDSQAYDPSEWGTGRERPFSLGVNAAGEVVPVAPNPGRGWLDWSVDSGSTQRRPRLRIKGLVEPMKPSDLPPAPDETGWRERHRKLRTAMAEDDNRTIAKLMEPVLDELHTKEAPKPAVPPLDWSELEPAMVAELREWGKAHGVKPGSLGLMILVDESAAVRLVMADEVFEMRFDRRSVRAAWRDAEGRPRSAAAILVQRGSEELAASKARSVICVPDFTGGGLS